MEFRKHSELEGLHSFLSASSPHWINYDDEKLVNVWHKRRAAAEGTALHEFASLAIRLGQKLENSGKTVNQYVNDCIGYGMTPEQPLYYSPNAFGTADAISCRPGPDGREVLRIFDLKTGVTKANGTQLIVYSAYFCLEYNKKPGLLDYDLRIYQNDDWHSIEVNGEDVSYVMSRIVSHNEIIEATRREGV